MLNWQDMKNFAELISINLRGFYVIKTNLVQTLYLWKFVYRPIFKWSNIGGPIYEMLKPI